MRIGLSSNMRHNQWFGGGRLHDGGSHGPCQAKLYPVAYTGGLRPPPESSPWQDRVSHFPFSDPEADMLHKALALVLTIGSAACAAAEQPTDESSPIDREKTERSMTALQRRFQAIALEKNAVIRDEKLAELSKSLKGLEGTFVTWKFPTRFSQDGRSIVLDLPKRSPYQLATTNYGDYLLPSLTTPQLRLGRDLDPAAFRKLKGGESVEVKGIIGADLSQFGVSFNLVGRIVGNPFGQRIEYEAFKDKSTWAGQCVAGGRARSSLKIVVTERTKDSFKGTCTDLKGFRAYVVTGKLDGDKAEVTIHRGNERERFPYFTTFRGTVTDGFVMKGAFAGGTCLFSLME